MEKWEAAQLGKPTGVQAFHPGLSAHPEPTNPPKLCPETPTISVTRPETEKAGQCYCIYGPGRRTDPRDKKASRGGEEGQRRDTTRAEQGQGKGGSSRGEEEATRARPNPEGGRREPADGGGRRTAGGGGGRRTADGRTDGRTDRRTDGRTDGRHPRGRPPKPDEPFLPNTQGHDIPMSCSL